MSGWNRKIEYQIYGVNFLGKLDSKLLIYTLKTNFCRCHVLSLFLANIFLIYSSKYASPTTIGSTTVSSSVCHVLAFKKKVLSGLSKWKKLSNRAGPLNYVYCLLHLNYPYFLQFFYSIYALSSSRLA